jgi:hypothetical protein
MATRWAGVARGWAVAVFSTFVAALSHTLAGATVPGALAVVVSLAFAGILCIGLAGRALSLWRVACSVVASQVIFHGLFSLGAPGGMLASGVNSDGSIHGHLAVSLSEPVSPVHAAAGHDAVMPVSHLIAALVTIAAIRYGDTAHRALATAARLAVLRLLEPAIQVAGSPSLLHKARAVESVIPHRERIVLSSMRHRGPPVSWNFA